MPATAGLVRIVVAQSRGSIVAALAGLAGAAAVGLWLLPALAPGRTMLAVAQAVPWLPAAVALLPAAIRGRAAIRDDRTRLAASWLGTLPVDLGPVQRAVTAARTVASATAGALVLASAPVAALGWWAGAMAGAALAARWPSREAEEPVPVRVAAGAADLLARWQRAELRARMRGVRVACWAGVPMLLAPGGLGGGFVLAVVLLWLVPGALLAMALGWRGTFAAARRWLAAEPLAPARLAARLAWPLVPGLAALAGTWLLAATALGLGPTGSVAMLLGLLGVALVVAAAPVGPP